MRRAVLIYNPVAGRHAAQRQIARIEQLIAREGYAVDVEATSGPGDAESLARAAAREGVDAVFICGGDGSLRECAAGILGSPTALGFIPSGTANVMARVLRLPSGPLAATTALARGATTDLDIGLCNDHPFLMQASAGLDAEILRRSKPSRKRLLGKGEIALAAISGWLSYSYPAFEVTWNGTTITATFAAICNIPFYGGPWRMAPGASWSDRQLDLVLFSGSGRTRTLGFARDLAFGRHSRRPDVVRARAEDVVISATPGLDVQVDGDPLPAALPARLRISSRRVTFLVPS